MMMFTLMYGTGNPAKLDSMRNSLSGTGIRIIGLRDMQTPPPAVPENGTTPLENARQKALAYYRAYGIPVFSCDSGLYFDGLPDEEQPGVHVRNINGRRLSDEEMTEYYRGLARRYGGKLTARYLNAVCLVLSEDEIHEHMGADISGNSFCIVDIPHEKAVPGYPLDRISVSANSGEYFYDMSPDEYLLKEKFADGFQKFFTNALIRR